METNSSILGIDIGGTGTKGAIVNVKTGEILTKRLRFPTPQPATPPRVAGVIRKIKNDLNWKGPIGCGFPAVVQKGVVQTAINVDDSWIGTNAVQLLEEFTKCPITVINDADAAGLAELKFGAGKNEKGVVAIVTLGTGVGSALFINGKLVPNTELGQVILANGITGERYTSNAIRKGEKLSWEIWGKRLNDYLNYLCTLTYPDLVIIGGGVSKRIELYRDYLQLPAGTKLATAAFKNQAGIVGGAIAAGKKV